MTSGGLAGGGCMTGGVGVRAQPPIRKITKTVNQRRRIYMEEISRKSCVSIAMAAKRHFSIDDETAGNDELVIA